MQTGTLKTDFRFTGQRSEEANFGSLYDYGARFYSPLLGKFLSPDTIIPAPGHPQSLNRYAYTANNPLRYTDPTGHWLESALDIAFIIYDIHDIAVNGLNLTSGLSLVADVAGLALPAVTGGGLLVRGIAHADDVAKAVSHVDDIAKAATHADELMKAAGHSDDAAKAASHIDNMALVSENGLGVKSVAFDTPPSTAKKGIYEFADLQHPGKTYVGQSGNIPKRLEQHVAAGRLSSAGNAKVTSVPGGKFRREIAEQDRISQLGGIPGGKLSNQRNPIGKGREVAARGRGLRYSIRR